MKDDLVDVGLIGDAVAVAAICQEVGASGALLVCNGSRNIEALIDGIVVIDKDKEAWALCGTYIRKVSVKGAVACLSSAAFGQCQNAFPTLSGIARNS
jgi:hypothetical protein